MTPADIPFPDDPHGPVGETVYDIQSAADGPAGVLPLTDDLLRHAPSGDLFGLSQNVGMGWAPAGSADPQFLILSTQGGVRAPDGRPVALGYHTGHWEIGLLVEAAAEELRRLGKVPFAGYCSDPCDGRSQGTTGMFDSLPYRNDAAIVLRRLARSLPLRRGVLGIATCDKGLPAMLMALCGLHDLPGVIVPGGVTLPPRSGEDAGKIQTIGTRYAHGLITLEEAADLGCRACATPGGGCQFLGTAATAQVVAEALGLTLPHAARVPSGQPVWRDLAVRSARALVSLADAGSTMRHILTTASIRNALVVHAAFGGSTNLLLHIPAFAHAAGLPLPTVEDWINVNRSVPRLVSVLPNGPVHHPTVRVFLAGGVPEVMLHLDTLGLIDGSARTVSGWTVTETLDWWRTSERRKRFRRLLAELDSVDPDDVILLGGQGDGDRSGRDRRRWRLPARRPGAGVHEREKRDRRDQGGAGRRRRRHDPRRRRPDGDRHGGDLSGHQCPQAHSRRQQGGAAHRCPVLRRLHRCLHWPRRPRGARRWAAWQARRRGRRADLDRHRHCDWIDRSRGVGWP